MGIALCQKTSRSKIARSGYSGHDSGPGRSFFDNDPDTPRDKQVSDRGSPNSQASKGDNNQASVGGGGGGSGGDGSGAGGGTSAAKDSRGGGSSGSSGGGAGSASRYGGGEDDKWRKGSNL
jgi:hypothetical protein